MTTRTSMVLALGFVALVATWSGEVRASAAFPSALQQELELAAVPGQAPGCRLCHKDDVGGLKTAVMPFGRAVSAAGAAGGNVPSLLSAIRALDGDRVDSDDDGVADIDELRAGTDPNVAVDGGGMVIAGEDIPLPETGCALGAGPRPSDGGLWLLLVVSLLTLGRRASFSRRREHLRS